MLPKLPPWLIRVSRAEKPVASRRLNRWEQVLLEIGEHTATLVAAHMIDRPVLVVINRRAGTSRRRQRVLRTLREMAPFEHAGDRDFAPVIISPATVNDLQEELRHHADTIGSAAPVIISLGGDGTHNQVMHHGSMIMPDATFVRLPLGSGNDGVVAQTLTEALDELNGPIAVTQIPAVVATTAAGAVYRAFNIVSLGIDAFVPIIHQRLRRFMPGNTYRIIANPAILFYQRIVQLQPATIRGETAPVLLLAMGVTGHRTYGDHIRILPGPENVCIVQSTGLREIFTLKAKLLHGTHGQDPHVKMFSESALTIEYSGRIPIQFDGEAFWLEPADFPLQLKVDPAAVRTITPARIA